MPNATEPFARSSLRAVEGDHLGHGGVKTDLQALDLAEPAVDARFVDTIPEVLDDRGEPGPGPWVDAYHRAADTGVFVGARCRVRAATVAEFELALLEVLLELGPLVVGRLAVFLGWTNRSPARSGPPSGPT